MRAGVVRPRVDTRGRGSVRQFGREEVFRILVALWLQEAGVQIPVIKPLMTNLDRFMEVKEVQELAKRSVRHFDLVEAIRRIGSDDRRFHILRPAK